MDDSRLLKLFAQKFLPMANNLAFGDTPRILLFSEYHTAEPKEFEYALAVAPFPRKTSEEEILPNSASIPDAWVFGENVTILFEFKVTGTINEAQFASHRRKLSAGCREIEISWKQIGQFFREVEAEGAMAFLLKQFEDVISDLISPRPTSGMPKQIISRRKAQTGEPYFIITGNATIGKYDVAVSVPRHNKLETITEGLGGIQESRRWIERYIEEADEPAIYLASGNVVIDHCVSPGRARQEWNRWYIGSQGG